MIGAKVTVNGIAGNLHYIDYKNKTAVVEMDYSYLVEYKWNEITIN